MPPKMVDVYFIKHIAIHQYSTRQSDLYLLPDYKKDIWRRSISFLGVKIWKAIILAKIDVCYKELSTHFLKQIYKLDFTIDNNNQKVMQLLLFIFQPCILNYVYGFQVHVFHMHPLHLCNLQKIQNETDIGTYKSIGFLSPLQYKILRLVLTNQFNIIRLPHRW